MSGNIAPSSIALFSPFCSYLTIYGLILLAATIGFTTASGVYVFGTLRASRTIHAKLIDAVLGTTLRWVPQCPYLVHASFLYVQMARYDPHVTGDYSCYSRRSCL